MFHVAKAYPKLHVDAQFGVVPFEPEPAYALPLH